MTDIRTGSVELEDQDIDLQDLDQAYEDDLDKDEFRDESEQNTQNDQSLPAAVPGAAPAF
jgi:hypothetical protein